MISPQIRVLFTLFQDHSKVVILIRSDFTPFVGVLHSTSAAFNGVIYVWSVLHSNFKYDVICNDVMALISMQAAATFENCIQVVLGLLSS